MKRKELYGKGYFFLRKRYKRSNGRLDIFAKEYSIWVSYEYGKWRHVDSFETEDEADQAIEEIKVEYDNCIVE